MTQARYAIADYIPLKAREYAARLKYDHCSPTPSPYGPRPTDRYQRCPIGAALRHIGLPSGKRPGGGSIAIHLGQPKAARWAEQFIVAWDAGEITDLRAAFGLPPLDTAPTT